MNTNNQIGLPEGLTEQLRSFERRLCVMETIIAACGGLCGVFATYGILFASDRFWDTPIWLRALLSMAGGIILAGFAFFWMRHWWWRRRDTRMLAKLIQRQYRRLGDRLLGAVELAAAEKLPDNVSPALCRAAIRQVTEDSNKYDFKQAVNTRQPRWFAMVFAGLLIVTTTLMLLFPQAGLNALARWFKPLAPVERYTFVNIYDLPSVMTVPHGEPFPIPCKVDPESRRIPDSATCWIKGQPIQKQPVSDGKCVFHIPGQTERCLLYLRVGDAAREITINPVYRPELLALRANVVFPEYLKRPPQTNALDASSASFLVGSKVTFKGTVSRTLSSATMTVSNRQETVANNIKVKDSQFASEALPVKASRTCVFSWTDKHNLSSLAPYALALSVAEDDPPEVECRGIGRAIAILEDEVLEIETIAEDDYGLKELWLNWSSLGNKERGIKEIEGTHTVASGSPTNTTLRGVFTFSPLAEHIPEETVLSLCAYATDYLPGRKPSMSLIYRIGVLSRAQHAKIVQDQMEVLQARIDDLAREEEDLMTRNQEISKRSDKDLKSTETADDLKESQRNEDSNTSELKSLTDDSRDLLKEALRNKDIPEETLARWSEMTKNMQDLAEGKMQESSQALQQARMDSKNREKQLEKAIQKEKEIVEALRQTEKSMDNSIKDMLAKNFVNRLRMAARNEDEIASGLTKILPATIGMSADNLPAEQRDAIKQVANRQNTTRLKVSYIRDDLEGFFNRTRRKGYDTVHAEMIDKKVVEALAALTTLVENNVGVRAIEEAGKWRDQLNAWADFLDAERQSNGEDQQGQEGQQISEQDLKALIALMRVRQREESLRDQTRILEQNKDNNRQYKADARKLGEKQNDLARDTRPLERQVRNQDLRLLVEKVGGEMMNAGMFLRKPQTDSATVAIETEIIELLSNLIKTSAEGTGGMGQMLMQAMGMQSMSMGGAGRMGGGSMAGGTTDAANTHSAGPSDGNKDDNRSVEKAGGIDSSGCPKEFRHALEAYHRALEEK